MAILQELDARLVLTIQDTSFDAPTRRNFLNQAVREIAGGILMPNEPSRLSLPLPELYTMDTVKTATAASHVDMPADFGRHLFFATAGVIPVKVFESFAEFLRHYPTLAVTSPVMAVAVKGKSLYYQGRPSTSATINLHYFRKPRPMEDNYDEPDGIPEHLQEALLVNWAAREIYNLIEDGIADQKTNTLVYGGLFNKALLDLEAVVGIDQEPVMLEAVEW